MLAAEAPVQPAHVAANRVQVAIVRLLNRARAPYGLPRLRMTSGLNRIAASHSQDLAAHGMFSHSSSDGTSFADRIRRVTGANFVGENLMEMTGRATASRVVQAWMNSRKTFWRLVQDSTRPWGSRAFTNASNSTGPSRGSSSTRP